MLETILILSHIRFIFLFFSVYLSAVLSLLFDYKQGKKVFKSYCLPAMLCYLFWFPREATKCELVTTRRSYIALLSTAFAKGGRQ